MNWCVYLLECRGGRYYIGITDNLEKRMKAHREGKGSKFVRAFSPFTLKGIIPNLTKQEAMQQEYKLKKLPRKNKAERFNV